MPLSTIDFGESIIPLTGTDAFFIDTNLIIAYIYDKHEKHLPCYNLINYLSKNDVVLCISEIVVVELINSLARILFIADSYSNEIQSNGEPSTNKEKKNLEYRFKRLWSDSVIKQQPEVLKQYNSSASSLIGAFVSETLLIECNDQIIEDAMSTITTMPLASADAMIVSTAMNFGCQYILSIDRDMSDADNVEVISTSKKNEDYDSSDMLQKLDLFHYLYTKLGDAEFKLKFPTFQVPESN